MTISGSDSMRRAARHSAYVALFVALAASAADSPGHCAGSPEGNCTEEFSARVEGGTCAAGNGVFMNGLRSGNRLALTFDACPTQLEPSFTPDVVDYLEKERIPTTFFISGTWAEAHATELARIARVPFFEIGLHGHRHPRLVDAKEDEIRSEIEQGRAALLRLGVVAAPIFRPPYWDQPPVLAAAARRSGVLAFVGDVSPGDPSPTRTAEVMERDSIRWVQGGSVVVMHVNGRGYGTAEAVRNLVPLLKQRGYEFVRASDLVRECRLPPPTTATSPIPYPPPSR